MARERARRSLGQEDMRVLYYALARGVPTMKAVALCCHRPSCIALPRHVQINSRLHRGQSDTPSCTLGPRVIAPEVVAGRPRLLIRVLPRVSHVTLTAAIFVVPGPGVVSRLAKRFRASVGLFSECAVSPLRNVLCARIAEFAEPEAETSRQRPSMSA